MGKREKTDSADGATSGILRGDGSPGIFIGWLFVAIWFLGAGCRDGDRRGILCSSEAQCPVGYVCCGGACEKQCADSAPFAGQMVWLSQVRGLGFEEISTIVGSGSGAPIKIAGTLVAGEGRVSLDSPLETGALYIQKDERFDTLFFAELDGEGSPLWASIPVARAIGAVTSATQLPGNQNTVVAGRLAGEVRSDEENDAHPKASARFLAELGPEGELKWLHRENPGSAIAALDSCVANSEPGTSGELSHIFAGGTLDNESKAERATGAPDCPGMFIAKYDNWGQEQWALTGTGCAAVKDVRCAEKDAIAGLGFFEDKLILGNEKTLDGGGARGIFLAKYSDIGSKAPSLEWARQIQGGQGARPTALGATADGSLVLAANVYGNPVLETEGEPLLMEAGKDRGFRRILLARYRSDGSLDWARLLAGTGELHASDMALRDDGRFLLVGEFSGKVSFGLQSSREFKLSSQGQQDVFIAFFGDDGGLIWARREGGDIARERATAVEFVDNETAVVAGAFVGQVTFDPAGLSKTLVSAGDEDGFVLKMVLSEKSALARSPEKPARVSDSRCSMEDTFDPSNCLDRSAGNCIRYVDGRKTHAGDGSSWEMAFDTVQEAVDSAHCAFLQNGVCDSVEVWVARGTYHIYSQCPEDTVRLRPGVAVFGGFAGDEYRREERDPVENETILDGSDGVEPSHRVHHVVTGSSLAELSGFIIQGGWANGDKGFGDHLGGGLIAYGTSPTISQCVFRDNYASWGGGGIAVLHGSPHLREVAFRNNEAGELAGGFYSRGGSANMSECLFEANEAGEFGGGARIDNADFDFRMDKSRFVKNKAGLAGGGIFLRSVYFGRIENGVFERNQAREPGARGGGMGIEASRVTIRSSRFVENTSRESGGGLSLVTSRVIVDESEFRNNAAEQMGGGGVFAVANENSVISRSEFYHNAAGDRGGGFCGQEDFTSIVNSVLAENSADVGGALAVSAGEIINCTITDNTGKGGAGGILFEEGAYREGEDAFAAMWNTISRNNAPYDNGYAFSYLIGDVTVQYSDIGRINTQGHHNFGLPPKFVDAEGGDYRLMPDSPCIDAASSDRAPEFDIEGNSRWDSASHANVRGIADMGAYEFQPEEQQR